VDVWRSSNTELMSQLQERRSAHRPVASRLAQQLKAIRQDTDQRLRRQSDGRLDRRQLANAVKGQEDVYTQVKQLPKTSFAASLTVDMSGSMSEYIHSGALYDAAMVLGDTFEMLEVPYDVRAFGSHEVQFKSMGDTSFAPERAAGLSEANLGGTRMADSAGLAQAALQARPEHNRIFVSLTDGALNDHEQSRTLLADARKNGIVTFGIFLGEGADTERMDQLYGRGNWTIINTLTDMPKAVGQRLASIFKSIR
jgi:nitric oxide reductase activation protein